MQGNASAAGPAAAAQRNWPFRLSVYHPLSQAISHLLLAMGATMLLLKLSGETLSGNTDTALDQTTAGWWWIAGIMCAGHVSCVVVNFVAYRHWRICPAPQSPIFRFIRMRGICEAVYGCLQHLALCLVVARLPAYVADAIRRAEAGGAGFGSLSGIDESGEPEPLGIHLNEGAPVSINVIMGPLWAAWIAQECVSIYFDAGRSIVPDIENDELRHQLTAVLRSIRIRPRVQTFVFNVQLSFCARMIDNAYSVSWTALFILAWLAFAFMLCSLCYLITALLVGHFSHGRPDATSIYRRLFCSSVRNCVMAMCTIAPISCNFIFSLNLSRRLDGDETISVLPILLPFIIGQFAAAVMMVLSMGAPPDTRSAALAGAALGLPMGPFTDMFDNTALLSQQLEATEAAVTARVDVVAGVGTLAAAVAATESRASAALEADRLFWEEQIRQYEATAPTELLRHHADGDAMYRVRADVSNSAQSGCHGDLRDVESGLVSPAETESAARDSTTQPNDSFGVCQICYDDGNDKIANTVLLPCGHGGICHTCGMAVATKPSHTCHMCRGVVLKVATVEPRGIDEQTGLLLFDVSSSSNELSVPSETRP